MPEQGPQGRKFKKYLDLTGDKKDIIYERKCKGFFVLWNNAGDS